MPEAQVKVEGMEVGVGVPGPTVGVDPTVAPGVGFLKVLAGGVALPPGPDPACVLPGVGVRPLPGGGAVPGMVEAVPPGVAVYP